MRNKTVNQSNINVVLDVSRKQYITDATHWYEEYNQLYHPTGIFGQDDIDLIYVNFDIHDEKFLPILLKEWIYLLEKDGYLVLDYVPSKKIGFQIIEKNMWWLWKQKYEILYHNLAEDKPRSIDDLKIITSKLKYNTTEEGALTTPIVQNHKKQYRFITQKKISTTIPSDTIEKWTFGIITNGVRLDWIERIIESIQFQNIPEYEIIICGTYQDREEKNIKYIHFSQRDDLGWITRKKNIIVKNAKYENLCIIHDRAVFDDDWYEKMKQYGNCYEFMCNRQLYEGKRAYDWTTLGGPNHTMYKMLMLDYRDWDWWVVVGGLQFITKKSIISEILLDETRYWNGWEDSDLTFRMRDAGFPARINGASVTSLGFRHGLIPSKPYNHKNIFPDMLLRRLMRTVARASLHIPYLHRLLTRFCSTKLYKLITKSQ